MLTFSIELKRLIETKDISTLGFFLSENESVLEPEEFENALELLQNLMDENEVGGVDNTGDNEDQNEKKSENLETSNFDINIENDNIKEVEPKAIIPSTPSTPSTPDLPNILEEQNINTNSNTNLNSLTTTTNFENNLNVEIVESKEIEEKEISNNNSINNSKPENKEIKVLDLLSKELLKTDLNNKNVKSIPIEPKKSIDNFHERNLSYNLTPPLSNVLENIEECTEDLTELSQLSYDDSEKVLKIDTAIGVLEIQDYENTPGSVNTPSSDFEEDDLRYKELQNNLWSDSKKSSNLLIHSLPSMDDYHPLLAKFDSLLVSLNLYLYNNPQITILTKDSPYVIEILNTLISILCHRTKPSLFGNVKNLIQILFKVKVAQKHIHDFEVLPAIRNMSKQFTQQKCLLFLELLLQRGKCMEIITELCTTLQLLSDHFEKDSILNDYSHRFQILQLVDKFCIHKFYFEFQPEIEILEPSNILTQSQSFLKSIIQYLQDQESKQNQNLSFFANEEDSPTIGFIFRGTFCRSLLAFLEHGKLKNTLFRSISVWDIILHLSKIHCGILMYGIDFQTIITTLDEVVPYIDNNHIVSDKRQLYLEDKIVSFICYCLNYKMLHLFLQIFFHDEATLKKYYRPDAMIRDRNYQESYLKFAGVCQKIPFSFKLGRI